VSLDLCPGLSLGYCCCINLVVVPSVRLWLVSGDHAREHPTPVAIALEVDTRSSNILHHICRQRTNTDADLGPRPDTAGAALRTPRPPSTTCRQRRQTQRRSRAWRYRPGSKKGARPRASWFSPSSSWPIASATDGGSRRIQSLRSRYVLLIFCVSPTPLSRQVFLMQVTDIMIR
jgi:hypothetical protein